MISKTRIDKRLKKKTNPEIVKTIELAKKNNHLDLSKKLSAPISQYKKINIDQLDEISEENVMVVGKVLGQGEINKKISISALGFSKQAEEKLKKAGCKIKTIKQEIKDNNKLEGIKVL